MRRAALIRSVQKLIGARTQLLDVVHMWRRHPWSLGFAAVVFVAVVVAAEFAGWEAWPSRIGLGLAVAAIAITASSDYRVLADTSDGLLMLRGGRVRQVATEIVGPLPDDAALFPAGGTLLATDWDVAGVRYTVSRSSEQSITRVAARRSGNEA